MAQTLRRIVGRVCSSCTPIVQHSSNNSKHHALKFMPHQGSDSNFSTTAQLLSAGKVKIHFEFTNGSKKTVEAKIGTNLLDVVLDYDVDIDGFGACEGTLACSTCHVVLPQQVYDQLPPPVDEELDMLDLAYDLQDTSRLGCQVVLTKELDGLVINVPEGIEDARG